MVSSPDITSASARPDNTSYDAFISYKHAKSSAFATDLELHLKRYARGWLARPRRIFRDEQHLHLGGDLPAMIREALDRSQYLILLASPQAAASPWVREELDIWCGQLGRTNDLLIILTDGEIGVTEDGTAIDWSATTALPKVLKTHLGSLPLWTDLSQERQPEQRTLENPEYKSAINSIVARLEKQDPNAILGEEWRLRRRNTRIATGTIVTLAVMLAVIVIALLLLKNRNTALTEALAVSRSHELAASSRLEHAPKALALARQAVENKASAEAVRALTDAMARFPALRAHLVSAPDAIETIAVAPGGGSLLYAAPGGRRIGRVGLDGQVLSDLILPGDKVVSGMVVDGQAVYAWSWDAIWHVDTTTNATQEIIMPERIEGGALMSLAVDAPKRLILGWSDGAVTWQSLTGGDTGPLYRHPGTVTDLVVVDGTILSTALAGEASLAVLRPGADAPVFIARKFGPANKLAISADGSRLAVGFEFPWVGVWSLPDLRRQWIEEISGSATAVTFWPANSHGVAVGNVDGEVTVFDERGDRDDRIDASAAAIYGLTPADGRLLSAGSDGWVRSWQPGKPGPLSAELPPADRLFWSGDELWGLQEVGGWVQVGGSTTPFAHSFGKIEAALAGTVVSIVAGTVRASEIGKDHMVSARDFPENMPAHRAHSTAISADGALIATAWRPRGDWGESAARVSVWELTSDAVYWLTLPHYARVTNALAFCQTGQLLAVMDDTELAVWNLESGTPLGEALRNLGSDPVTQIACSTDGQIVLGRLDGSVVLRVLTDRDAVLAQNPGRGSAISHLSTVDGALFAVDQKGVRWFDGSLTYLGPVVATDLLRRTVRSTAPNPSGNTLAVALQGGGAIGVPLDVKDWTAAAATRSGLDPIPAR